MNRSPNDVLQDEEPLAFIRAIDLYVRVAEASVDELNQWADLVGMPSFKPTLATQGIGLEEYWFRTELSKRLSEFFQREREWGQLVRRIIEQVEQQSVEDVYATLKQRAGTALSDSTLRNFARTITEPQIRSLRIQKLRDLA